MTRTLLIRLSLALLVSYCCLVEAFAAQPIAAVSAINAPDTLLTQEHDSLSRYDGALIDSIAIENREIYDTSDPRYRNFIFKTANRLHIVTAKHVIARELLLKVGTPFSAEIAEETARNLRTRYRLVDARVDVERLPDNHLLVRIVTVDQWSLVGGLDIAREGNRNRYKIGFEERNLLGQNQFLSFDWIIQEKDANFVRSKFTDQRFFGFPFSLTAQFQNDPKNRIKLISIGRPYYTLDQRISASMAISSRGGRHDDYKDSLIGSWESNADQFDMTGEYRLGNRSTKVGLGAWYSYHKDRVFDRIGHTITFPEDSLYHLPGLSLSAYHTHYFRLRRISGMALLEDITLKTGAELTVGRAFDTDFKAHFYDLIDVISLAEKRVGGHLIMASYQRTIWLKSGDNLRTRNLATVKYYNNSLPFLTLATRLQYSTDAYESSAQPLILGGKNGIRGYDEFALTGDRFAAANLETRWFPGVDILSAVIGGAMFVDAGKAWSRNEPFSFRNWEYSVGIGLRVSFERATRSEIMRIDCSVTREGDVQLAFGTGQYF